MAGALLGSCAGHWGAGEGLGQGADTRVGVCRGPLSDGSVRTGPQDSAAWAAAHSVSWEAPVGRGWGGVGSGAGRRSLHLWGRGGAHNLGGDSRDEGAGFLEPIEGLEKLTGVVTLPGQSFDTPDDLVMQIAGGEGVQ